jgi:ATP-binding protein involved in chromosome partitioning
LGPIRTFSALKCNTTATQFIPLRIMTITIENIRQALAKVMEPDLKKDIITLDLVKDISVQDQQVTFTVLVNNPALHSRARMKEACAFAMERAFGKELQVNVNVEPLPANRDAAQRKVLPGVKNIIAVASGKGGVGKSTITSNLAVGLAQRGFKVGLIDADIYGPSMPIMLDLKTDRPSVVEIDGKTYIKPLENYGVKVLSIGFFAEMNQAIVWRGPMATKALNQMISDVWWDDLDFMILDLPPGTGDIHLTLVSALPLSGAVIVSTPQEIALADARKAVNMFQLDTIKVPILGIVENMAFFTPEDAPDKKYYIFGQSGAQGLSENLGLPFLGEIPLVQSIREAGDVGRPAVLQENTVTAKAFSTFIDKFLVQLEHRNTHMQPTQIVKNQFN